MKQFIAILLSVILTILCIACHPSTQTITQKPQEGSQNTQPSADVTNPDDMMTNKPTDPLNPNLSEGTEPTEPSTDTEPPTEELTEEPTEPPTEPPTQPSYDAPVLTAEVEDMIKTAYMATDSSVDYTKDDLTVEYYGEYEGVHIAFVDGPWDYPGMVGTEILAGDTFIYGSASRTLMAFKDGQILSLANALDTGWLSETEIHELWNLYRLLHWYAYQEY